MSAEPPLNSPGDVRDLDTLFDAGNDWSDNGDEARAEIFFRAALEVGGNPRSLGDACFNLGNALAAQDRFAEAATAFQQAMERGDRDAPLNLGYVYEQLEDFAAAEAAFRRAIACGDPKARSALAGLGRSTINPFATERSLRQAAADGDAEAAGELGCRLVLQHRPDLAEPFLRQAVDVHEDARADLAWLLRDRDELDEAEALLARGVALGQIDSMIKLALLLEEDRGDDQAAESVLRTAIAAGELNAHNNLGTLLRDRGDLLGAQLEFQVGARGGDALAARNGAALRRTHRRQLNRAHRAARRAHSRPEH